MWKSNAKDMKTKDLFRLFNRKAQSKEININETRLYRFTSGDVDQLSAEQIERYKALLKASADEAIKYLDSIIETKTP